MKGSREIALEILNYFDKNGYIPSKKVEIALSTLSFEARKFTVNLYLGTLRKRVLIDHILKEYLKKPDKLPVAVRNVLRLGVFQLYFLNAVPEYAAIKESVELVGVRSFRNLVNAVLRKITKERVDLSGLPLWLRYSHPQWLVNYIEKLPYMRDIRPVLEYNQAPPMETYVVDPQMLTELEERGFIFAGSDFSDAVLLVERGIGAPKLHRIDEMEYILKGMKEKMVKKAGSALSLLNERPWLFSTLKRESFSNSKEQLLREIMEIDTKDFFLLLETYSLEETHDLVLELAENGYEYVNFDSTLGKDLRGTEQDYGVYYFPPDAPKPCFITYLKKR
ncbi:MAG: hypothetical protein DRP32_06450 [Thermotogae bacterium]|nr:MAG: hypothetical protein DRP32_06450 [Thermotogota bacterium]